MQGTRTKSEAMTLAAEKLREGHWVRIRDLRESEKRLHPRFRYKVEWKRRV